MKFPACYVCNKTQNETLPYGTGRKPICCDCAMADNERLAVAKMYATENANQVFKNVRVIEIPMSAILEALDNGPDAADALITRAIQNERKQCDCENCRAKREHFAKHAN